MRTVAKRKKQTQWNRTLIWWGASLIIVIIFVAYPTGFEWSRWQYGLIWGIVTACGIYLFRGFFEKPVDKE
jgi:hypothetical protein